MRISNINWLSKSAKEAEIEISDGFYKLIVFSQPCEYKINQKIDDYIHPLEVKNLQKTSNEQVDILKLQRTSFGYKIIGTFNDAGNSLISVGNIKFQLSEPIPSWAREGDIIEFESIRFDLW